MEKKNTQKNKQKHKIQGQIIFKEFFLKTPICHVFKLEKKFNCNVQGF